MRVIIALDGGFGEHGEVRPGEGFWLVESLANRRLADRLWAEGGRDPGSAVFRAAAEADPTEILIGLWPTILDHHPEMTEAVIPGYQPTKAFEAAIAPSEVRFADGQMVVWVQAI